jgi:hypothetical protein
VVGQPPIAAWRLLLSLDGPLDAVRFEHVRTFASELVERGPDAPPKDSNVKEHTAAPLAVHPEGQQASLEVTTLSVAAGARLEKNVEFAAPSLGRVGVRIVGLTLLARTSYDELAASATPHRVLRLGFLSPTAFLHGRSVSCFPDPGLVFGSHRARWNRLAPAHLQLDVDFAELGLVVRAFEGRSGTVSLGVRSPSGRHRRDFVGFVGNVEYQASRGSERELGRWQTLAGFAPFCGTGANTAAGMGVTMVYEPIEPAVAGRRDGEWTTSRSTR